MPLEALILAQKQLMENNGGYEIKCKISVKIGTLRDLLPWRDVKTAKNLKKDIFQYVEKLSSKLCTINKQNVQKT